MIKENNNLPLEIESLIKSVKSGACLAYPVDREQHTEMDAFGKANGVTVVFAPWHPSPEYRIFNTGTLLSRNEEYPCGLVIVNKGGFPKPWQNN